MQTPGHTHTHTQGTSGRQRTAHCEKMFDIIPKRCLFDHTSPLSGGWFFAASAALGCTRKIARRTLKDKKGGRGEVTGEEIGGYSVHLRGHAYICRPLAEFNHSHMKGHLS